MSISCAIEELLQVRKGHPLSGHPLAIRTSYVALIAGVAAQSDNDFSGEEKRLVRFISLGLQLPEDVIESIFNAAEDYSGWDIPATLEVLSTVDVVGLFFNDLIDVLAADGTITDEEDSLLMKLTEAFQLKRPLNKSIRAEVSYVREALAAKKSLDLIESEYEFVRTRDMRTLEDFEQVFRNDLSYRFLRYVDDDDCGSIDAVPARIGGGLIAERLFDRLRMAFRMAYSDSVASLPWAEHMPTEGKISSRIGVIEPEPCFFAWKPVRIPFFARLLSPLYGGIHATETRYANKNIERYREAFRLSMSRNARAFDRVIAEIAKNVGDAARVACGSYRKALDSNYRERKKELKETCNVSMKFASDERKSRV